MTTTLAEMRRAIGRKLMDYVYVKATSGGVSTSIITDNLRLVHPDGGISGTWALCATGHASNVGEFRRIVASTYSTTSVQLSSALPQTIQQDDEFDLFNINGRGWSIDQYNQVINDIIRGSFPSYMVPATHDVSAVLSSSIPLITDIPETMYFVYDVHYQDSNDEWISIPPRWWDGDIALNAIRFKGHLPRDYAGERNMRLYGTGSHALVSAEDDEISLPFDYVMYEAAHTMAGWKTSSRERLQAADRFMTMANQFRADLNQAHFQNAKQVRSI